MTTVLGSIDGIAPTYNQTDPWRIWNAKDIFDGSYGSGKYVPKVGDWVAFEDGTSFIQKRVTSISDVLIASYVTLNETTTSAGLSESDIIFGVGPGSVSDIYRLYINKNVFPYTLTVDRGVIIPGSTSSFCQIVLNAQNLDAPEPENSVNVISALYNSAGQYQTNRIPLELAAVEGQNFYLKVVTSCYSTLALNNNDVVTLIVFTPDGHVAYKRQLMVENTSFIKSVNTATKRIVGVSLESPFVSLTTDHLIEVPVNVPVASLQLLGVVTYSDGTKKRYAVGSNGFTISGLGQFVSVYPGENFSIILNYEMKTDGSETAISGLSADGKTVIARYAVRTVAPNNTYGIKLMVYPVWNRVTNAYQLEWFMLNLDRNVCQRVTDGVRVSPTFQPQSYGPTQQLSARLNFQSDVPGFYSNYMHTQAVDVTLFNTPFTDIGRTMTYKVGNNESVSHPIYGTNLYATIAAHDTLTTDVNISCGLTNRADWIQQVYRQTYPVYNPLIESMAPDPTHFKVCGVRGEYETGYLPFTQWANSITVGAVLQTLDTVVVKFYKLLSSGNYLTLSAACLTIRPN